MSITTKLKGLWQSLGGNEEEDYDFDDDSRQNYSDSYSEGASPAPVATEDFSSRRRLRNRFDSPAAGTAAPDLTKPTPSTSNVIGMPGSANGLSEVVVMEPRSFEEMPQAIQALRERKSVVLNLTLMDPDQAQRAVDFIAGGTYALDGHQERIGESIFLFTPNCVQVSTPSGVVHEVPQLQTRAPRSASSTPSWPTETSRALQ